MTDMAGPSLVQQDSDQLRPTLTISDIGRLLAEAGVPRSERQIKRYCQTGFLDARKVPGPTGDQWFIAPHAVPKLIGDLEQWTAQRRGHGQPRPAAADPATPQIAPIADADTAGQGLPRPAVPAVSNVGKYDSAKSDTSAYVLQLETRILEKDDQIRFLREEVTTKNKQIADASERARETNILIRGLQNLVLQLQAPSRASRDSSTAEPNDPL